MQRNESFYGMPIDVLMRICSYLGADDLIAFSETSKDFRNEITSISQSQVLWRKKFMQYFPHFFNEFGYRLTNEINWYQRFVMAYKLERKSGIRPDLLNAIKDENIKFFDPNLASENITGLEYFEDLEAILVSHEIQGTSLYPRALLIDFLAHHTLSQRYLNELFTFTSKIINSNAIEQFARQILLRKYAIAFNQPLEVIMKLITPEVVTQFNRNLGYNTEDPLHLAISLGNLPLVTELTNLGIIPALVAVKESVIRGRKDLYDLLLKKYGSEIKEVSYISLLELAIKFRRHNFFEFFMSDRCFAAFSKVRAAGDNPDQKNALVYAAENDDHEVLQALLAIPMTPAQMSLFIVLKAAIERDSERALLCMLDHVNINADITDIERQDIVEQLIRHGKKRMLELLFERKLVVPDISKAAEIAIGSQNENKLQIFKLILERSSLQNSRSTVISDTVLNEIAAQGLDEILDYLLENEFVTREKLMEHSLELGSCAVNSGRVSMFKRLLALGVVDVNQSFKQVSSMGITGSQTYHALHIAAGVGDAELASLILSEITCDPNRLSSIGETPLYHSIRLMRTRIIAVLLNDHRIDVNKPCESGTNPLKVLMGYLLCENGSITVLNMLLNHNDINVNYRDREGMTPVMHLIEEHYSKFYDDTVLEAFKLLINHKLFSPNELDNNSMTALGHAVKKTCHQAVRLLLEHKDTDITVPCGMGASLIQVAKKIDNRQILKLLRIRSLENYANKLSLDGSQSGFRLFEQGTLVSAARKQARILRGESVELTLKERLGLMSGELKNADELYEADNQSLVLGYGRKK